MSEHEKGRTEPAIAAEVYPMAVAHGIDVSQCRDLAEVIQLVAETIGDRARTSKTALRRLEILELELSQILAIRDGTNDAAAATRESLNGDGALDAHGREA